MILKIQDAQDLQDALALLLRDKTLNSAPVRVNREDYIAGIQVVERTLTDGSKAEDIWLLIRR